MTDPINNLLVSKRSKKRLELQPEISKPLMFVWKRYRPCKFTVWWDKFMVLCPRPQKVKLLRKQNKQNPGPNRHRNKHKKKRAGIKQLTSRHRCYCGKLQWPSPTLFPHKGPQRDVNAYNSQQNTCDQPSKKSLERNPRSEWVKNQWSQIQSR